MSRSGMSIPFSTFLRLLVTFFTLQAASAWAQQHISISVREANMRAGPGTEHPVRWSLSQGYPLQIVARRGEWLQVRDFDRDTGWVHRRLTGAPTHHVVSVKTANLRQQPGTNARRVAQMEHGEIVRRVERRGDWLHVEREDGQRGWVARRLLWGG